MKIAVITYQFPTISQTFILNQITGLIDRGHKVDVFGIRPGTDSVLHGDVTNYHLLDRTMCLTAPRNKFHRLKKAIKLFGSRFGKNPLFILSTLNPVIYGRRAINLSTLFLMGPFADYYDIIHCHFGVVGNYALPIKKAGIKSKFVTTFHGFDTRLGCSSGGSIYKELFEYGDCFVAVTDYNYKHLVQFGLNEQKIVYHSLGVDIKAFHPQKVSHKREDNCIRIITVARLVKEKGLHYGIKAICNLIDQLPDIKIEYHIIGDGPLRKQLELMISELGMRKTVFLHGEMTQDQIKDELDHSQIFLLPSVEESFGVVLLEAQAKCLPVVASKVGSTYQALQDGVSGFLVPPGDVWRLTDRLSILASDRQKRSEMGEAGRKYVKNNYNINELNDRLVKIYEELKKR
ncbi:MAG: glycosyltransferase [Desulfosporosinus sp.]|nr:glycosyltransferase [Desulfosporosinus sp.]